MAGIKFGTTGMKNVKLGTTQAKKMYLGTNLIWTGGAFTAASVNYQGAGGFGISAGNYTFNVISSDGPGTGGQIIGIVDSSRRLTGIVSIVDGGSEHEIGDILTLEMVGETWFQNPKIEVTAL